MSCVLSLSTVDYKNVLGPSLGPVSQKVRYLFGPEGKFQILK